MTKQYNQTVMWVSEWRIEKNDWTKYKITNGGVYSPTDDLLKAKQMLKENIKDEVERYLIKKLICPSCKKSLGDHSGSLSYERCLINICMRKVAYV